MWGAVACEYATAPRTHDGAPVTMVRTHSLRYRAAVAGMVAVVILLGLLSRSALVPPGTILALYGGDTLWALMVYLLVRGLGPQQALLRSAGIAALFSYAIEFSQLYHAGWIDALRRTLPGRLVLGSGFLWSDLLCYTVGIAIGAGAEWAIRRWAARQQAV